MKRVLPTGMSGTGKSTLVREIASLGIGRWTPTRAGGRYRPTAALPPVRFNQVLRRGATMVIDANRPVEEVVQAILNQIQR